MSQAQRPPNILITIADDQRGTALGCAGIEPVLTPALDALAARGVRFTQAQHLGSCVGAICAPSRAMLHTGIPYFQLDEALMGENFPAQNRNVRIPPTLGQKLRKAGYHAFATGKWHNGVHSFRPSFSSGSNLFFDGMADHWYTPVYSFDPTGEYPPESRQQAEGFSTEVFGQSAIDFIRSRQGNEEPFFCYCAFTAPHDPLTPPDVWRRRYNPSKIHLPPNLLPRFYNDGPAPLGVKPRMDYGCSEERDELLLGLPRDAREIQRSMAEYYGMISHMDDWIGKIHQSLEETGQLENTIVIHTSDHGIAIGQHGLMGKQNLYRHSMNVPLLISGPNLPKGVTSDALCYQHDLHPTLTGLVGAEGSSPVFQDLLPVIRGEGGRTYIGAAFRDLQRSIRDTRYKLIEYLVDGERSSELFDLSKDPWETKNLISDPSLASTLHQLRKSLRQWQDECGDSSLWCE